MTLPWASRKAAAQPWPGWRPLTSLVSMPWRNASRSRPVDARPFRARSGRTGPRPRGRRGTLGEPRCGHGVIVVARRGACQLAGPGRLVHNGRRAAHRIARFPAPARASSRRLLHVVRPPPAATCRGAAPRIRITSSSRRSCSSRRRWSGSCPSTTSSSTAIPTLEAPGRLGVRRTCRRLWYPLGYNVRPLNLHGIAREAVASYGGRLPDDAARAAGHARHRPLHRGRAALLRLRRAAPHRGHQRAPGARARVPRARGGWPGCGARRPCGISPGRCVPRRRAYDYNQALMDFGATWCTARAPRCRPCPMKRFCATYRANGHAVGRPGGRP